MVLISNMTSDNFILYKTSDNKVSINVQIEDETVWLTQDQMAELFDKSKPTIVEHLGNIFEESELDENSVVRKFRITAANGKSYNTTFYSAGHLFSITKNRPPLRQQRER